MKYTLILLKDGRNILVSDKSTFKQGDVFITKDFEIHHNYGYNYGDRKIIAGIEPLPTLDYSDEVSQVLRDKYGWVDVEELAKNIDKAKCRNFKREHSSKEFYECVEDGFVLGFKTHQSITNKMFSLKDIEKAILFGQTSSKESSQKLFEKRGLTATEVTKNFIQFLQQPIQLKVEVETENKFALDGHTVIGFKPKITNNSILVTKIL